MNRLETIAAVRDVLRRGGYSIGSWIQIPHASIAEIMGAAGYDWVAVDMEHGSVAFHQLPDLFRALELGRTLPLVRLAEGTATNCKLALDAGAGGVIVPNISSAAQLEAIRGFCRWPPAGGRGVGFSRANLFGKRFAAYTEEAQAPLLVAMIEDVRAVEQLDAILAVNGLDAILIGPYDLSASMGLTAQFEHPDFTAALESIRVRAHAHHIPSGVHVVAPSVSELQARIGEGYRFIAYSIDSVMLNHTAARPAIERT
jgi:2-dehydro-3-deoxyglucarate aldolase